MDKLARSRTNVDEKSSNEPNANLMNRGGKLDVIQDVEEDSSCHLEMRSTISDKGKSSTYISSTGEDEDWMAPQISINKFHKVSAPASFGTNFITLGKEKEPYRAKCNAVCLTDCHLMLCSFDSFEKIRERIFKKKQLTEIQFLREVSQLSKMSTRILKRIWEYQKIKTFKRNQEVCKEGDPSKYVYIVKSGQF